MGRSLSNPGMSRKQNKERKEKNKFFRVKKYRKHELGKEKMKEHNKQQEVVGHNKAILNAKLDALRAERRAKGITKPKRKREEIEDEPEVAEPKAPTQVAPVTKFTGERWIVVSPGVLVRKGEELDSAEVGKLDNKTLIDVVEMKGRRGRLAAPLQGWVSIRAKDGASICQPDYDSDADYSEDGQAEAMHEDYESGSNDGDEDGDEDGSSVDSNDFEVKVNTAEDEAEEDEEDEEADELAQACKALEEANSVDSDSQDAPPKRNAPRVPNLKTKVYTTKKGKEKTIVRDRAANKEVGKMSDMLDVKFRSMNYNADRITQKQNEVTDEGREAQKERSTAIWKRLNPLYVEEELSTTNKSMLTYDPEDYKMSKVCCTWQLMKQDNFRVRDRHTEYVEYLVRDQALARKKAT